MGKLNSGHCNRENPEKQEGKGNLLEIFLKKIKKKPGIRLNAALPYGFLRKIGVDPQDERVGLFLDIFDSRTKNLFVETNATMFLGLNFSFWLCTNLDGSENL